MSCTASTLADARVCPCLASAQSAAMASKLPRSSAPPGGLTGAPDGEPREAELALEVRRGASTSQREAERAPLLDVLGPLAASVWRDLQATADRPFQPYGMQSAPDKWPMEVLTSTACLDVLRSFLAEPEQCQKLPGLLVVGTSLGDEGPRVPATFLEHNVVLVLRNNCRGPKRYGYSSRTYARGDPGCWEGPVDLLAAQASVAVVHALRRLGCRSNLGFLGISAGCHKVMTALAEVALRWRDEPLLLPTHVVLVAGAFHEGLFMSALPVVHAAGAVIVHHHRDDGLCPWRVQEGYWERLAVLRPRCVYLSVLTQASLPGITHTHNVCWRLCAARAFWTFLALPSACLEDAVRWCRKHRLGRADLMQRAAKLPGDPGHALVCPVTAIPAIAAPSTPPSGASGLESEMGDDFPLRWLRVACAKERARRAARRDLRAKKAAVACQALAKAKAKADSRAKAKAEKAAARAKARAKARAAEAAMSLQEAEFV
jgi:hypothetical protein